MLVKKINLKYKYMKNEEKVYLVKSYNGNQYQGPYGYVLGKWKLVNVENDSDILNWYHTVGNSKTDPIFKVSDKLSGIKLTKQGNINYNKSEIKTVLNKNNQKEFNVCSNLKINSKNSDDFDFIFNLQKKAQESAYGFDFKTMSMKEVADFWFVNSHSLQDEIHEMFDALGGMHDGIGNAGWKYWKSKNKITKDIKVSDLSERDLKELKFEIVDAFHFMINFAVSINMTGSELYNMYVSKNEENINRQKNNY